MVLLVISGDQTKFLARGVVRLLVLSLVLLQVVKDKFLASGNGALTVAEHGTFTGNQKQTNSLHAGMVHLLMLSLEYTESL
jgi:hypothetical protein